jgi:hypothetical protein
VYQREVPEGEEDTFELTEEEQEEGPEQLALLETDTEVNGGSAWTPLYSSSNEHTKHQVGCLGAYSSAAKVPLTGSPT